MAFAEMTVLSAERRKDLARACIQGRREAEAACRAAIGALGLLDERPPSHLSKSALDIRGGLAAKRRQLGDAVGEVDRLVAECAYEQWHRLLFARFLAESNLLIHPDFGAPLTLDECAELADDLGEPDGWAVAGRFAAQILPGIFRVDDPCVQLRLAPEGRLALEEIVAGLPVEVLLADDAPGWVYQFWQKEKKDEINSSERKIGGADIAPVTQLFTESYMVRFLLENSLGAWWASRHPTSPLLDKWEYLRLDEHGNPAAGAFAQWPESVADVTVMDPCCGSGHFLVEAFGMLWRMRAEESGISAVAAQDAVLRDNLFGLELDPRCLEIAVLAIALTAWKSGGGWRELPIPNIACSGIPVKASANDWRQLADGNVQLEAALVRLHILFRDADTLGSLIDPKRSVELVDPTGLQKSFEDVDWDDVAPLLEAALTRETTDPATAVLGADATGVARAATYLSRHYTLVVTNVPYLTTENQAPFVKAYTRRFFALGKADLATVFLIRARELTQTGCTYAAVTPQAWLSLTGYTALRKELLDRQSWNAIARLGPGAFETITGEVVNVGLFVLTDATPSVPGVGFGIDATLAVGATKKSELLRRGPLIPVDQRGQSRNPDGRVILGQRIEGPLLSAHARSLWGLRTGDNPQYRRFFWELPEVDDAWSFIQCSVSSTVDFGGRQEIVLWEAGQGRLRHAHVVGSASIQGADAWGREGVAVTLSGRLPVTRYTGEIFANSTSAVWPKDPSLLPALWAFLSSEEFQRSVRLIDQKLIVMNQTLLKVPFDVDRWKNVAAEAGPLKPPGSNDPTQWLFDGKPDGSANPLHVATSRLLGYRWPKQMDRDDLGELTDDDGIVCLPSVLGERTAAVRVNELLARAYGGTWSPARVSDLLAEAGCTSRDLELWLRDEFFKSHCQLFRNRPFIWHLWDGRKDGFSALVNYHRLNRATLERLTYTYLGDWIERQAAGVREDVVGAEARLVAARNFQHQLAKILTGEPPVDIYVRWKGTSAQAIGWDPDLNDGVRLNIRPFVQAGVLRSRFNVKWDKDRGKDPDGSVRLNDIHLTVAEKHAARARGPA